ncbi:MAG: AraD1 family protein [Dongiaceae bacterium]
MRLIQFLADGGARGVARIEGNRALTVKGVTSMIALAQQAITARQGLDEAVRAAGEGEALDYPALLSAGRVLAPVDHPDAAHCLVTGTGLTHLGSADTRDKMHKKIAGDVDQLSDSMKMFRMGLEGGKPQLPGPGVQPEWFYKGDGSCVVPPGAALPSPAFALDGGEEGEIVGLYVIAPDGAPRRLGFALGNEFSDHVTERQNYLYLAHSKLRACSIGPELLVGALPADVRGTVRIHRDGKQLWQDDFLSGEANMTHSVANLEDHHFKYPMFRRPGDLHAHFFGAAVLSYAAGITCKPGDVFEIDVPAFGRPLRNPLAAGPAETVQVRAL